MRLCIQYAVTYPQRTKAAIEELDLFKVSSLTFKKPDTETFSLLKCAIDSIDKGGALPAVLNAANEVAVGAFLNRRIGFYDITESVCEVVDRLDVAKNATSLDAILGYDREARKLAKEVLSL